MTTKRIYLKKEINPDYYKIGDEHNELMKKWNALNSKIHSLIIPKFFFFKVKIVLAKLKRDGEDLNKDYIAWNKKATEFLLNPKFYFEKNQEDRELVYTNFTNGLKFIIEKMQNNMILIATNFNLTSSQCREQRNFIIAISAFIFGFIGFLSTIYITFCTPKIDTEIINKTIPTVIEKIDRELNTFSGQIDSLVSSNKDVIEKIEAYQRLDNISVDYSINKTLIDKDIDSAKVIENKSKGKFVED